MNFKRKVELLPTTNYLMENKHYWFLHIKYTVFIFKHLCDCQMKKMNTDFFATVFFLIERR